MIYTAAASTAIRRELRRLRGASIAVVEGVRMLAPEPARAAALSGADVIVWVRPPVQTIVRDVARTRALENRIYVIVCARASDPLPACVADPSGNILGEALLGVPSGFVAAIDTAESRSKCVVAGTDAFDARIPRAYDLFVARSSTA